MKAIVYYEYGSPDVLSLAEVAVPVPKSGEVMLKVHATGLNAADWRMMRADPFLARFASGLFKPKMHILGADVAGVVEAIGDGVSGFQPGDEVYGDLSGCGFGGLAEYAVAPASILAKKPKTLSFEDAAAVPMAAATALQGLRDVGEVRSGECVLIQGAGGGVGTFAVQLAKAMGAEVTAVCGPRNAELVRTLGADHVIDYNKEDFTQSGRHYDVIVAVNGYHPIRDYKRALAKGGRYVMIGGTNRQLFEALLLGPWLSMGSGKKLRPLTAKPSANDLTYLADLIDSGKVKPIVDKTFRLEKTADAVRYLELGHLGGKLVVAIGMNRHHALKVR